VARPQQHSCWLRHVLCTRAAVRRIFRALIPELPGPVHPHSVPRRLAGLPLVPQRTFAHRHLVDRLRVLHRVRARLRLTGHPARGMRRHRRRPGIPVRAASRSRSSALAELGRDRLNLTAGRQARRMCRRPLERSILAAILLRRPSSAPAGQCQNTAKSMAGHQVRSMHRHRRRCGIPAGT
jgi:hypothetical protein